MTKCIPNVGIILRRNVWYCGKDKKVTLYGVRKLSSNENLCKEEESHKFISAPLLFKITLLMSIAVGLNSPKITFSNIYVHKIYGTVQYVSL